MGKIYLGNAFSLQMLDSSCAVSVQEISVDDVKEILSGGFISAVGHTDTASVVTNLLDINIPTNRVSVTLEEGDTLIVAQVVGGRLPEGTTILPEGTTIKFLKVTTNKIVPDPIELGTKILENFGYKVSEAEYGYNSMSITVKDSKGNNVSNRFIGN